MAVADGGTPTSGADERFFGADPPDAFADQIEARLEPTRIAARLFRAPVFLLVLSADDRRVTCANPTAHSLTGETTLVGRAIDDFVSSSDADDLREVVGRVQRTGESVVCPPPVIHPAADSEFSPDDAVLSMSCSPLADDDGPVNHILLHGVILSSSWRGQLSRHMVGPELSAIELVQTTFNAIDDAIFIVRLPDRTIQMCNAAAAEMLGLPRDELIGLNTREFHVDDESYEQFQRESVGPLEETGSFRGQFQFQRADGSVFPTEHVISLVGARDDDPRYVVSVVRDITERQQTEKRLRDSERKFSTAFRMNPLAMAIVRLEDNTFLDVNEGFCELTGYEPSELLGNSVEDAGLWTDDTDRREVAEQLRVADRVREFESVLRRADGELRTIQLFGQVIDIDGERHFLSAMRDVTRQRRYEAELEHRSLYDPLTDLPNRSLFHDRLEHTLQASESVAVVFLDVDRFKVVNETLGHTAGDKLLQRLGQRLSDSVSDAVTVARFGADEFVLLYEDLDDRAAFGAHCRSLVDQVTQSCEIADTVIHPELSAGVAVSTLEQRAPGEMLRHANVALSKAKSAKGNAVSSFDPQHDTWETEQLHRENALREAVANREFVVYYQPVLDLQTRAVVGAEALVRWDHPDHGIVSPGEFIPLAEETGFIVPIGYQVLEQSTDEVAGWLDRYPHLTEEPEFDLSVNLSARQYREADLDERIRQIADASQLPLYHLVLEITESILVTGQGKLQDLRESGARIAIDDFGTGYSSLQYLRTLDADELKIDQSFVTNLNPDSREQILIEAMLRMGRQMGLDVVTEGIETDRQKRQIVELGGEFGQGYHFARPMPADEFEAEWLADRAPDSD